MLRDDDHGAAQRLRAITGHDLIYVAGRGWHIWKDSRFRPDPEGLGALVYATERLRPAVEKEADWLGEYAEIGKADLSEARRKNNSATDDELLAALRGDKAAAHRKWARTLGSKKTCDSVLSVAAGLAPVEVIQLDADPRGLPVANGRVCLDAAARWRRPEGCTEVEEAAARAVWLGPAERKTLPTRASGVAYDATAECPAWEAFLALVLPCPAIRAYVQRCLGYLLSGENPASAVYIVLGPGGNGKSIVIEVLGFVLGELLATVKAEAFTEAARARSADDASPSEAAMVGARAIVAPEIGARATLDAEALKRLTGGETRQARNLHKAEYTWKPQGVPILVTNGLPDLKDGGPSMTRRLHIVPFDVDLEALPPAQRRDKGEVLEELKAEAPGILNWLIDGWRDYCAQGFAMPPALEARRDEYVATGDPVGAFIRARCEQMPGARIARSDFCEAFVSWAAETGATSRPWSRKAISGALRDKGVSSVMVRGHVHLAGLAWCRAAGGLDADTRDEPPF